MSTELEKSRQDEMNSIDRALKLFDEATGEIKKAKIFAESAELLRKREDEDRERALAAKYDDLNERNAQFELNCKAREAQLLALAENENVKLKAKEKKIAETERELEKQRIGLERLKQDLLIKSEQDKQEIVALRKSKADLEQELKESEQRFKIKLSECETTIAALQVTSAKIFIFC